MQLRGALIDSNETHAFELAIDSLRLYTRKNGQIDGQAPKIGKFNQSDV